MQELTHDKESLQRQVHDQMNQISSLKAQVNGLRFGGSTSDLKLSDEGRLNREEELRQQLTDVRDALSDKQQEVRK